MSVSAVAAGLLQHWFAVPVCDRGHSPSAAASEAVPCFPQPSGFPWQPPGIEANSGRDWDQGALAAGRALLCMSQVAEERGTGPAH